MPEEGSNRLLLVDGYRRILALRRLGRDTACVESWACDLAQALLRVADPRLHVRGQCPQFEQRFGYAKSVHAEPARKLGLRHLERG